MSEHEFHTLDECPANQAWLDGDNSVHCSLRYVYTFPSVVDALWAESEEGKHRRDTKFVGRGPWVWYFNSGFVRLDRTSGLEFIS